MTTKLPQIPNVSEETVLQVVEALAQTVNVREGRVGDQLDRTVTFRDLIGLKLAQDKNQEEVHDLNKVNTMPVYTNGYDFQIQYDPTSDLTPPPQANTIKVSSTIGAIFLRWTIPSYRNHSFTEIWRSQNGNIGDAVLIAQSTTGFYTDPVETNVKYFYWLRLVSQADVRGAYSQDSVSGQAEIDPKLVIEAIEGEINANSLTQDLQTRLLDIENTNQEILAQDINTAIAREAEIRSNVEEGLLAQYTVKIDNNGAISGFGLASQEIDGSVESAFIIRADKFAIVQPTSTSTTLTGTPASASIPFTVDSDGRTIIKSGVIGSASISSANIESLDASKLTVGIAVGMQFDGGVAQFNQLFAGGSPAIQSSAVNTMSVADWNMRIDTNNAFFNANYFAITNSAGGSYGVPFEVSNGFVRLNNAIIGNATIGFAKIADDIQSTNYSSGSSGWRIFKNGNAEFNNITLGGGTGFATSSDLNGKVNASGGTLTAGVVKSSDNKFVIDLANKSILITS